MIRSFFWLLAATNLLLLSFVTSINADSECPTCTLTVMCWMNGGLRGEGCSGPSWLMTCCVPQFTRNDRAPTATHFLPKVPKAVGGLRSASGSGPLNLANTIEEIANLGRNDLIGVPHARFYPHSNMVHGLQFDPRFRPPQFRIVDGQGMTTQPSQNRYFVKVKPQGPHIPPYKQQAPPLPTQVLTQQQLYQTKNLQTQPQYPHQPFIALNSINSLSAPKPVCGVQPLKSKLQKRIIGGDQAVFGEFPWQVHIRIAGFQCGGVLLNNHYIATAAHCVHRAKLSQIIIYLGEYDTKDQDRAEVLPKETLGVVERRIHPQFKYMLTQPDRYDVALLKLSRAVVFRDNILPICLPPQGKDYEGALGVVAGWGKTDTSFGKTGTNLLQKVYVPIINNRVCFVWHELKDIILELHDEMFCAGHEQGRKDACLGDSGGPLVVNDGGRWTLVGITSAGFGCAVDHQPGIYHKVSKTVPWILANIND